MKMKRRGRRNWKKECECVHAKFYTMDEPYE